MGDSMFSGCTALASVQFAQTTQSLAQNAFENCTALTKLSMPADTFSIPNQFAKGCTALTSFSFAEPGELNYSQCIGQEMLAGTSITSLTFPSSLTSLNAFDSQALKGLDQLKELHFNGMSYDQLVEQTQQIIQQQDPSQPQPAPPQPTIQVKYATDKIYCENTMNVVLNWAHITDKSLFITKSSRELCQIMSDCFNSNIPIVMFVSSYEVDKSGVPMCGHCRIFAKYVLTNSTFIDYVCNNKKCIIVYGDDCASMTGYFTGFRNFFYACGYSSGSYGTYIIGLGCWKKPDGTLNRFYKSDFSGDNNYFSTNNRYDYSKWVTNTLAPKIDALTEGFNAGSGFTGTVSTASENSVTVTTVNATIAGTNCFGLGHDVKIYSNDGKSIDFIANASGGSVVYTQNVQVDNLTVNDFRYGQWYGNAKMLKPYADANYIPVLAIATQGDNYRESMKFNNDVFNNAEFQAAITTKRILLCKIDSPSFSSGEASYLLNNWMQKASFPRMPLIMLYWLKKDGGGEISNGATHTFDIVLDDYAYYSSNSSNGKIDDAECVHSSSEFLSWLNSTTTIQQYVPQDKFNHPEVTSYLSRYPKYKAYPNQPDDDYGRYFPVGREVPATVASYDVNVNNSTGAATWYTLSYSTPAAYLPPQATYQYFSLPYDDTNAGMYESMYQISGLMFKIGYDEHSIIIRNNQYAYNAKTEDAYIAELGIDSSKIYSSTSSFFDDLYEVDSNDDPTTTINLSVAQDLPFLWNVKKHITLNQGVIVDSKPAVYIDMWLSSNASRVTATWTDDEGDSHTEVMLQPGNPQYVISANVNGIDTSNVKLLWIKEFYNN